MSDQLINSSGGGNSGSNLPSLPAGQTGNDDYSRLAMGDDEYETLMDNSIPNIGSPSVQAELARIFTPSSFLLAARAAAAATRQTQVPSGNAAQQPTLNTVQQPSGNPINQPVNEQSQASTGNPVEQPADEDSEDSFNGFSDEELGHLYTDDDEEFAPFDPRADKYGYIKKEPKKSNTAPTEASESRGESNGNAQNEEEDNEDLIIVGTNSIRPSHTGGKQPAQAWGQSRDREELPNQGGEEDVEEDEEEEEESSPSEDEDPEDSDYKGTDSDSGEHRPLIKRPTGGHPTESIKRPPGSHPTESIKRPPGHSTESIKRPPGGRLTD
jgi:hypothetical protein